MAEIGDGTLGAMARLGLSELRNAVSMGAESVEAPTPYGMYGNITPGEVSQGARAMRSRRRAGRAGHDGRVAGLRGARPPRRRKEWSNSRDAKCESDDRLRRVWQGSRPPHHQPRYLAQKGKGLLCSCQCSRPQTRACFAWGGSC